MSFTLATSGAILLQAGKYVSTDISGALLSMLCDNAEAYICDVLRYDVVSNYGSVTTEGKKLIQDIVSSYAAKDAVKYDMSGYTSRAEAEIILDVLDDKINKNVAILKEDKAKTYLNIT